MKLVTSFKTLMQYAKDVGDAKKEGNSEKLKKAQLKLDAYKKICLISDEMSLNTTIGNLL